MPEKTMNSSHTSSLLSESHPDEGHLLVLVRKHIRRYVDEQNWQRTPLVWFEAGGEV
jgi:hypothetical protein